MTHFATFLPDWNSLESVRHAHSDLEFGALVFFALLVVCEALAHLSDNEKKTRVFDRIGIVFFAIAVLAELVAYPYGQRNDTLSEQVIGSLDAKARDASSKAAKALTDSGQAETLAQNASDVAGPAKSAADEAKGRADAVALKVAVVSKKAEQIDAQLSETQWAFSARDLLDRDKVIEQLKEFRGKTVFVRSYVAMGDVDGYRVCQMVLDLARSAGMTPIDECAKLPPSIPPATGIQVCGPDDNEMLSLSRALSRIDIGGTCAFGKVPHSPNLTISVGAKALIAVGQTAQTIDAAKKAAAKSQKHNPKP